MKIKKMVNSFIKKFRINYYKVKLENPIESSKEDILGFDSEAKRLKSAIKEGANTIGLISDFGAGKSSIINLLKRKLCCFKYKIVKINLWDDDLSIISDKDTVSPNSVVKLHKSFLRQLSLQLHRYRLNYVNKRLNLNYGIAKISFPNYRTLFAWLISYLSVLGVIIFLISKYFLGIKTINAISYTDKISLLNKAITLIPLTFLIFIILFIIFNKEVLFSLWNSSKDRNITEEDTIELYNDLVSPIFFWRIRKLLIVIEDLDRINNDELVKYYVKEFYRIYIEGNNNKCKNGITFIFCLKDEFLYKSNQKNEEEKSKQDEELIKEINKNERKFLKLFDYICNLPSIYINDYEEVLKQLVVNDKLLKNLINTNELDINELQWIIRGENLNIRVIKSRLETFKSIYLRLLKKSNEINKEDQVNISVKMCAFAAFAKSEYPSNLYYILENTYSVDNQNYIDIKINDFLLNGSAKLDSKDANNNLKKYIVELINNEVITEEYKEYFYNIPKGIKPLTISESKISKSILNDLFPDKSNTFDSLIDMCNNDFLLKQLNNRIYLGRGLPTIVFLNNKLFENACLFNEEMNKLSLKLFVANDSNIEEVCDFLNNVKDFNISRKKFSSFLVKYVNQSIDNVKNNTLNVENFLTYRKSLYNCLRDEIIGIKELYDTCEITEEEMSVIDNLNTLIELCGSLSIEKQNTIMLKYLNGYESLKYEDLLKIVKKYKNLNLILKLNNIDNISQDKKIELYETILQVVKELTVQDKINILNKFNFYEENINKSIIEDLNDDESNEKMYIEYINNVNIFDENAVNYFSNNSRIYWLNKENYEKFKNVNIEKYYVYKSIELKTIDPELIKNKKLLINIFVNYLKITELFNNSPEAINVLFDKKAYRKINLKETDKLMLFAKEKQNVDVISFVLYEPNIDLNIKVDYFSLISSMDRKSTYYLYSELSNNRNNIPSEIKRTIYINRNKIFKEIPLNTKRSIAKKLSNDIK